MGIKLIQKRSTLEEVLELMHPLVREWFRGRFRELTEPQAMAIPLIHRKKNVLISSPTGSGKTLTAFLSIINELLVLQENETLDDRIYCVYVSPLKALANDIEKNLERPLRELCELAVSKATSGPRIRVGVRSGDTSQYERQKMVKKPPHIFITTPESLAIALSSPKFRQAFLRVRYLIIDEIHELCSSKRGVALSLTLERLQAYAKREFTRIGLSATQAPINDIARFLVGYDEHDRLRSVSIAVAKSQKGLDLSIMCPVDDMTALPYEITNSKLYDRLRELIETHKTTLIFTNTRGGTETVVHKLKERGVDGIAAHHGSLSKETRLEVEDALRSGKLKAVACSTSLELGIDIGHIDLVVQIGSPKSIAKGIQRIGRAGHGVYETPTGRLMVFESDDLVECSVLVRNAYEGNIDRVSIPRNCLDVLAQTLVGMSLEKRWGAEEAFSVVRKSYCYRTLPDKSFYSVLSYLAGRHSLEGEAYAKISYRDEDRSFGIRKGSRMIYFLNGGTIPEESSYKVFSDRGVPLGSLSEKFVEKLRHGDIFLLGGKTYEFDRSRGMRVFVTDARGRRPTVPSWSGEMLPRTFDLSVQIGRFRAQLSEKMASEGKDAVDEWLRKEYRCDAGSARSILSYFREQLAISLDIPTDLTLVLEGYRDPRGSFNIVFHYCFGRRTNDALSRAYAFAITKKHGVNVSISLSDDNFMLSLPKEIPLRDIEKLVTPLNLERFLRSSVRNTELFKQRFRHAAMRSFMILRNYKGREIPVSRQLYHSSRILEALDDDKFPVMEETFNEILHDAMDIDGALGICQRIASGDLRVVCRGPSDIPSPFAHNIVLMGISDIVLMEDRSALLRDLHRRVLDRAFAQTEPVRPRFSMEEVQAYFRGKQLRVDDRSDILYILRRVGPLNLLQQRGKNVFDISNADFETTRKMALELIKDGSAVSAWRNGPVWVAREDLPRYFAVYADRAAPGKDAKKVLAALSSGAPAPSDEKTQECLRKLEKAYLIERRGEDPAGKIVFASREVASIADEDRGLSLRNMTMQLSEFEGPMVPSEIAFALCVDETSVNDALAGLEDDRTVASGLFTPGSAGTQYMLMKDKMRLEARTTGAKTFDESHVLQYVLRKQFTGFPDIESYFSRFYEAGMAYDLSSRVECFDIEKWWKLREEKKILHGRFSHGRVGYIRASDARLYVSAFRAEPLRPIDVSVLKFIKRTPGATLANVVEQFGSKAGRDELKEVLDKLDRNLFVVRGFFERREWSSRNRYLAFPESGGAAGAPDELLLRSLRAHGPLHIGGLKSHTGEDYDLLVERVLRLEERGTVERIVSVGTSPVEMYMMKEEITALEGLRTGGDVRDRLRILSLYDPYVRRIWAEVASRYGEGWFFPVVKNGHLAGMVEKWQMSGCVDVRELSLLDMSVLPELLDELDNVMAYYRSMGTDIIRIRRVMGQNPPELDAATMDVFVSRGYKMVQGNLVKGDFVPNVFSPEKAMAYVLFCQHAHPQNRYRHTLEAAAGLGGIRSDFEAGLRCQLFVPVWRLVRQGALVSGLAIPEHLTYCLMVDLMLYKAAKNRDLDDEMKDVLMAMPPYSPITRSELGERVTISHEAFAESLKRLYGGLYIVRDMKNRYILTKAPAIKPGEARRKVLRRIIENFGMISAEKLSSFVKHEFRMSEIRQFLRDAELEGWLVKGYLVEGDGTLYWMLKSDLDKPAGLESCGKLVLSPTDALSQYYSEEIREKFGIGACFTILEMCKMTGAFKATTRSGSLSVSAMAGGDHVELTAREFGRRWGLKVEFSDTEAPEPTDEWEIITWYEKRGIGRPDGRED